MINDEINPVKKKLLWNIFLLTNQCYYRTLGCLSLLFFIDFNLPYVRLASVSWTFVSEKAALYAIVSVFLCILYLVCFRNKIHWRFISSDFIIVMQRLLVDWRFLGTGYKDVSPTNIDGWRQLKEGKKEGGDYVGRKCWRPIYVFISVKKKAKIKLHVIEWNA